MFLKGGAFDKAEALGKKHNWVKAVDSYKRTLRLVGRWDFLKRGKIQERIGHCFYRAAFQAETHEEFKRLMELSARAYETGAKLFERLKGSKKRAKINSCRAKAVYNKSWLAEDSSQRRALLNECWKLAKTALETYEETGSKLGYGKTCNDLLTCLYDRQWLAQDWQEKKNIVEEAIQHGERAVKALSETRDKHEQARACYMLSYHLFFSLDVHESIKKQKEIGQKCLTYAQKALETSEKIGDSYLIGMSSFAIGMILWLTGDFESSLRYAAKQLEKGTSIKDNLMIARAYSRLAYSGVWKMNVEEDPVKRRKGFNEAIQYAEDAIARFQLVSYPFTGVYMNHIECYSGLARDATNLEEKQVLLKKAVEVGRKDLEHVMRSGSPYTMGSVFHSLSKALFFLSTAETKLSGKKRDYSKKHPSIELKTSTCMSDYFHSLIGIEV
jgi:tetratricopeptide (TPR) repeat protein